MASGEAVPDPVNVVAIHRYFWPDTAPYASFLRVITARWAQDGERVTVLTSQPSYSRTGARQPRHEIHDQVEVRRLSAVPGRGRVAQAINMVWFPLVVATRVLTTRRPGLVMCSTVPQVTLGYLVSLVARMRGAAFVYHCMDLHPEIGVLSGEFAHPVVRKVLSAMDLATMRRAKHVVVLSDDMAAAVARRDPALADRIEVIANFALPADAEAPSPLPDPEAGTLRVVFTGNLGRFQGLADVVDAAASAAAETPVELVFMGKGCDQPAIEERARANQDRPGLQVRLLPPGSPAEARSLMRSAHVGVVSLIPHIADYAYPSKTATYAEEGLPMLVVCETTSALARSTRDEGLGWSAEPGDVPAMSAALVAAAAELADGRLPDRRERVHQYAQRTLDRERLLQRWSELATEIQLEEVAP